MNGADGCADGCGIGLANWQKIGRWFKVCRCLVGLVLDCQWMDGLVEDRHWIARSVEDWIN